nr:unnamed protein product [Callosobruchus chinensis]
MLSREMQFGSSVNRP